jgi:hypothetical protein
MGTFTTFFSATAYPIELANSCSTFGCSLMGRVKVVPFELERHGAVSALHNR